MELFSLQTFLFFPLLFLFYFHTSYKKPISNGFKHYPILGFIPDFIKNRHRFLDWTAEILKRCPSRTASLYRPVNLRRPIPQTSSIFSKPTSRTTRKAKNSSPFLKISSVEESLTPMESYGKSRGKLPAMNSTQNRFEILLQKMLPARYFEVAFNVDPGFLDKDGTAHSEFMRAFDYGTTLSADRFLSVSAFIWKIKRFFNIGSERLMRKSIALVHEFANNIIRSRLETMGRDSTSTALTWFFWLLSFHSNVEEKILKELESIRTRNGKSIGDVYSFEELRDMNYLHAAISEAMRLYPPVPNDTKECMKNDMLPDGTFIGEGWFITYITYAMGRMESIWGENCYEYLPERWLENGIYRPENMFRFPVFHSGPRICLGKDMAYIQMESVGASVIERFVIDVQDKDRSGCYL
ncbi:hypothetical protein Patl1_23608 [Pistacia atlantica]|uniref:Uncharacterized protein n=1 Tax=Pistacia atlantica TaxID=434234 RepID=A0ACC0ZZU6_9ROSI|nr:hypothetical protein Patl1_23608 [Pistacia atlantica]